MRIILKHCTTNATPCRKLPRVLPHTHFRLDSDLGEVKTSSHLTRPTSPIQQHQQHHSLNIPSPTHHGIRKAPSSSSEPQHSLQLQHRCQINTTIKGSLNLIRRRCNTHPCRLRPRPHLLTTAPSRNSRTKCSLKSQDPQRRAQTRNSITHQTRLPRIQHQDPSWDVFRLPNLYSVMGITRRVFRGKETIH